MGNTVKIDLAKLREKINGNFGSLNSEVIQNIVNECIVKEEAVEHPAHYQGKNECIDVIRAMLTPKEFLGFLKGNSIKYRFRSWMKNGEEDVKKAEWYETALITERTGQVVIKTPAINASASIKDIVKYQESLKRRTTNYKSE